MVIYIYIRTLSIWPILCGLLIKVWSIIGFCIYEFVFLFIISSFSIYIYIHELETDICVDQVGIYRLDYYEKVFV